MRVQFVVVFALIASCAMGAMSRARKTTILQSVADYNYAGCFVEPEGIRTLGDGFYRDEYMSITMCAKYCEGFQYFGVEFGTECWCGQQVSSLSFQTSDSACRMMCPGDHAHFCGEANRLNIYEWNGVEKPAV